VNYLVSIIAGGLFVVGLLAVGLARAQGWKVMRSTAIVAFSSALYCFSSLGYSLAGLSDVELWIVNAVSWFSAAGTVLGWLVRVRHDEATGESKPAREDRWLAAGIALAAVIPSTPYVGFSPDVIQRQVLGITYSEFELTWVGDLAAVIGMLAFLHVVWCYIVAVRTQASSAAWIHLLSMALVVVFAVHDALNMMGLPSTGVFLFQFSLIGVTAATLVDVVQRAVRDANAMKNLSTSLQSEVARQTQSLLGAQQALLRAERLASLGQLAAGVGHEINNPLTYIKFNLEFLEEELRQGGASHEALRALAEAQEGADRIRRVVADLKAHVREETSQQTESVMLRHAIDSSIKLVSHQFRDRAVFEVDVEGEPVCAASSGRLEQVLVNLLINAVQATPDANADRATVRVRAAEDAATRRCVLEVIDRGCGIATEHLPRVFEPFFTTKPMDKGTGLGLYIASSIVTGMSGTIAIDSAVGEGTTVRIELPSSTSAPLRAPSPTSVALPARPSVEAGDAPKHRVLIIDDDELVGRALRRMLRNYLVEVEQDGVTALERLRSDPRYAAILCDLSMSPLSGIEVFERVCSLDACLAKKMVFITGGALSERSRAFLERSDITWLPKPIDPAQLNQAIDRLLRRDSPASA
jgi:signal transduction histidine kinase/ActR/RegA family two-component response regulator